MKNSTFLSLLLSMILCTGVLSASSEESTSEAAASSATVTASDDRDLDCVICLDTLMDSEPRTALMVTLPCGHSYHDKCAATAFIHGLKVNRVPQCPIYCTELTEVPATLKKFITKQIVQELLEDAAIHGYESVVDFLTSSGANITCGGGSTQINTKNKSPLHLASERGNLSMVNLLLAGCGTKEHFASSYDRDQKTALQLAIENGHADVAQNLLVHAAANLHKVYSFSSFLNHQPRFVIYGETVMCACSVGGGSYTPIESDLHGDSALHTASRMGRVDLVTLLLKYGAYPLLEGDAKEYPLEIVAALGSLPLINLLSSKEMKINGLLLPTEHRLRAVERAAREGNTEVVVHLLTYFPKYTKRALELAAINGRTSVINALCGDELSIDIRLTLDRKTALHLAAEHGQLGTVVALLSKGAKINLLTLNGKTAANLALKKGFPQIAAIIQDSEEAGIPLQPMGEE